MYLLIVNNNPELVEELKNLLARTKNLSPQNKYVEISSQNKYFEVYEQKGKDFLLISKNFSIEKEEEL